jgi:hypothetical protein
MPPLKTCPNPACRVLIYDWHAEWMTDENRALVNNDQAGVDCPECGAFVMIPHHVVTRVAPENVRQARRSMKKAEQWAQWAGTSLENYLKTEPGSQYAQYEFEP